MRTPVFTLFMLFMVHAQAATPIWQLEWDANSEPNLAGYEVYMGGASRSYTNSTFTTNTSHPLTCLPAGTYYFAVTAKNTNGVESKFSEELKWTTLTNTPCPPDVPQGIRVRLSLESAADPAGPWFGKTNEIVLIADRSHQFFRTRLDIDRQ